MSKETIENSLSQVGHIKTYTGKLVQPLAMTLDDLDIHDIAHALTRVCRFAGHCRGFMSVAMHSMRVLDRVESIFKTRAMELAKQEPGVRAYIHKSILRSALLHDASEAYLGDLPRPLKRHPAFAFYREAEKRLELLIAKKFELMIGLGDDTWPAEIHEADNQILTEELKSGRYSPAVENHEVVEAMFLQRWEKVKP